MGSLAHAKTIEKACEGDHVGIWGLAGQQQLEAALTSLLAEREQRGSRVPVVSLLMRGREDGEWIERAISWLSLRGRRVIVRTRVVMPRSVVSALADAHRRKTGAVVELELAHHKPAIQSALLPSSSGTQADSVAALLLQAQHLETLELPVVARLAPLLPGIHDQPGGFTPLLRNLVAADVRRVVLEAGHLHTGQLRALLGEVHGQRRGSGGRASSELSVQSLLELARAYGVDSMVVLGGAKVEGDRVHKLKPRRAQVLAHGLEQLAREHDNGALALPRCGCHAHCDLNPRGLAYEPVMGRDLFAGLA